MPRPTPSPSPTPSPTPSPSPSPSPTPRPTPTPVDSGGSSASAVESTVGTVPFSITASSFAFGAAVPGAAISASAEVVVRGNGAQGYVLTLQLSDLVPVSGPPIPAAGIALADCGTLITAVQNAGRFEARGLCPSGSLDVAQGVATSGLRTLGDGDRYTFNLRFTQPWVTAGSYAGTATFAVSAL